MKIGCSGQVSERSGIGIMQKSLYTYLAQAGHELVFSETRDLGMSPLDRTHGLLRGLKAAGGGVDTYLSTVPPLPFGIEVPTLTIVCDLRWSRTRSNLGAAYRAWDLHRSVKRSTSILCISENTLRDLVNFDSRASGKATFQWLGPGQVPEGSFDESDSGLLLLVGGAAHKRNEHAAAILARARPAWVRGILGVGVSAQVREMLSELFPCEWNDAVSDQEMLALYKRSEFFLMLGTDEGFGLPFVEALATGCQVIASDHPLAREVVGPAGVLLRPGRFEEEAEQLGRQPSISADVRLKHLQNFSWKTFGAMCEAELVRLYSRPRNDHRGTETIR